MAKFKVVLELDRVLAKYGKWPGDPGLIGEPVDGAVKFVETLLMDGYKVSVLTARTNPDVNRKATTGQDHMEDGAYEAKLRQYIVQWLSNWGFPAQNSDFFVDAPAGKPLGDVFVEVDNKTVGIRARSDDITGEVITSSHAWASALEEIYAAKAKKAMRDKPADKPVPKLSQSIPDKTDTNEELITEINETMQDLPKLSANANPNEVDPKDRLEINGKHETPDSTGDEPFYIPCEDDGHSLSFKAAMSDLMLISSTFIKLETGDDSATILICNAIEHLATGLLDMDKEIADSEPRCDLEKAAFAEMTLLTEAFSKLQTGSDSRASAEQGVNRAIDGLMPIIYAMGKAITDAVAHQDALADARGWALKAFSTLESSYNLRNDGVMEMSHKDFLQTVEYGRLGPKFGVIPNTSEGVSPEGATDNGSANSTEAAE